VKIEEISQWNRAYIEKCMCGKEIQVFTQPDNDPEYYTTIYVKCDCGDFVKFSLPVN